MVGKVEFCCWWVTALGIPFVCCDDCHGGNNYEVIITPQGTSVLVCCGAYIAYHDYNGPLLADPGKGQKGGQYAQR